jgi:hypothetical protein
MRSEILQPIVALIMWSMVMWLWMYITRIPAIGKSGIDTKNWVGSTGKSLDDVLPDKIQWKAHNYNHLMEQPTLFYAVALVLAIAGAGDGMNAKIAWAYVILRIVHSLIQATWNKITVRFSVYMLSNVPLLMLITHAALTVFKH